MKEVFIIGAGGHAAEIDEYIQYSNKKRTDQLKVVGFLDDNPDSYSSYQLSAPFLGTIKEHKINTKYYYVMGIANPKFRKEIISQSLNHGAKFLTIIHSNAYVSSSARIGVGNVIGPYVNIGPNVHIGEYNLINSRTSLGHDTRIGDYNFISPNVSFSGFTEIGDDNLFGINSATIPGIRIGNGNKIMAGMVLDRKIEDGSTIFFRYKEKLIAKPK